MSLQASKPSVGSSISVTTRYRERYYYSTNEWRDNTYTGTVLPDEPWFGPFDFKLSTDDPNHPFRVINLKRVINIGGLSVDNSTTPSPTKLVTLKGSKGNEYVVTITDGSPISCTCPGFSFRKTCKHLRLAVETVDSSPS